MNQTEQQFPPYLSTYPRLFWFYALLIFIAFLILITFLSANRYKTFQADISELMDVSARAAANEIESTIKEIRRAVSIFTAEHAEYLANIYNTEEVSELELLKLNNLLEQRVPNMFTYTIANEDSTKLIDDFNLNIGDICKIDIQNFFLNSFKQNIRIHPHPSGYHFDIMIPFVAHNNEVLVFFVSFLPKEINRILDNYTNQNFNLIVSSTLHQGLIEVTNTGTRDQLKGSFYLTGNDIHSSFPITNSHWEVTVVTNNRLFSNFLNNVIAEGVLIMLLFLAVYIPILWLLIKQFKKKQAAIHALKESEIGFFDMYEYAPDIYMTIDSSGRILSANKHAREFFHIDPSKTKDIQITSLCDNEQSSRLSNHISNIYTCSTLESEFEFERSANLGDYKHIYARFRLTPSIPNIERNLRVVCRDITHHKLEAQAKLQHAQTQREALVREVHHRIKNNLQNIISLLKTYTRKNPELKPAVKDLSSKIASIAEAFGLQGRSNSNTVYISDLVTAIVQNERKLFLSHITLSIDDQLEDDGHLIENEVTPIAVVLSELITNAIKHGKKTGAPVADVKLHRAVNGVKIIIENKINIVSLAGLEKNKMTSGQGKNLIESLLPPKGAYLEYKNTGQSMRVTLFLETPTIIMFSEIKQSLFAVN